MYSKRCNENVMNMLKQKNWNRLHGNNTHELSDLGLFADCFNSPDKFEIKADIMIDQNKAFVQAVLTSIYIKNKTDYPSSLGPTDPVSQAYQSLKIQRIITAIIESYSYQFGSLNIGNIAQKKLDIAVSMGNRAAESIGRTVDRQKNNFSSTGTSIKRMFGWTKGGRYRHRKNGRRISRKI
jgi:hypothetical protein